MEFWRKVLKLHQRPSITVKEYCLKGKINYRILVRTNISVFARQEMRKFSTLMLYQKGSKNLGHFFSYPFNYQIQETSVDYNIAKSMRKSYIIICVFFHPKCIARFKFLYDARIISILGFGQIFEVVIFFGDCSVMIYQINFIYLQ